MCEVRSTERSDAPPFPLPSGGLRVKDEPSHRDTPPHLVSKANNLGPRVDEQLLSKEQTGALCLQGRVGLYTAWDTRVLTEAVTWTCPQAFNPQSFCGPSLTAQQLIPRLRALDPSSLPNTQRNRPQLSSFEFRAQTPAFPPQIQDSRPHSSTLRPKGPDLSPPPSDPAVQPSALLPQTRASNHNLLLSQELLELTQIGP